MTHKQKTGPNEKSPAEEQTTGRRGNPRRAAVNPKGGINMNRYEPVDLAKYIVNRCNEEKEPINNFRLQIILYEVQLESIRAYGEPMIAAAFEAWKFGPVIPAAYYRFGTFGTMEINFSFPEAGQAIAPEHKTLIDRTTETIRRLSMYRLWTREKQYHAWEKTFDEGRGFKKEIPEAWIAADAENENEAGLSS